MNYTKDFSKYHLRADCDLTDDGDHPCHVMDESETEGISVAKVDGFIGNGDGRESEALTQLFAAAPDMYEALKAIDEMYREVAPYSLAPALVRVVKALNKAEGKQ
jgi:hypothetical protein